MNFSKKVCNLDRICTFIRYFRVQLEKSLLAALAYPWNFNEVLQGCFGINDESTSGSCPNLTPLCILSMMKCKALTRLDYQGRKKGFLNSIKSRKLCDDDKSYGSSASFASPMGCLMVSEVKEKAKQTNKQLSNEFFRFQKAWKRIENNSNIQHL